MDLWSQVLGGHPFPAHNSGLGSLVAVDWLAWLDSECALCTTIFHTQSLEQVLT